MVDDHVVYSRVYMRECGFCVHLLLVSFKVILQNTYNRIYVSIYCIYKMKTWKCCVATTTVAFVVVYCLCFIYSNIERWEAASCKISSIAFSTEQAACSYICMYVTYVWLMGIKFFGCPSNVCTQNVTDRNTFLSMMVHILKKYIYYNIFGDWSWENNSIAMDILVMILLN